MSRPSAPDLAERLAALSPEKRELLERRLKERALESGRAEAILTEPGRRQAPLSFSQQRIWFLDRFERGGSAYNVPTAVRLRGTLDVPALSRSIQAILDRHASLRTRFPEVDGMPVQWIEEHASISFPVVDLGGLPADERDREARRMVRDEAATPFDLARGPVLRAGLIRLAADEHVFLCTLHHIVSDGWSRNVLFRELSALYGAYASGTVPSLAPLPIQYADYAAWQQEWLRSGRMEAGLDYWRNQLRDLPVLDLPTDHPRPAVQTIRGGRCDLEVPARVAQGLKAFCRVEGVTLFMAMISALGLLLRRYSGQNDQVIGSLTANRDRIETEGLIGIFINALAMRIDLSGDPTFRDLVRRVREVALEAYAYKEVPFEKLVQALQPQRDPGRSPIYQTMVNIDTSAPRTVRLPGLIVEDLEVPEEIALLDLTLVVRDRGHELVGSFEYNADLFEPETVRRMSGHLGVLLAAVVANPEERVSSVPILTEAERRRVVVDWNDSAQDYPADRRLHELFEARVERSPHAVALRESSREIEYGALNCDANRLARYLRSNGVGPGTIVGVCLERSARTVTALLAIFKAGAAYVPLDPTYPEERIAFMLKDSGAKTVLTETLSANRVANVSAKEIRLDEIASDVAAEDDGNLETPGTSEDLAYVIYTSGSTGTPKGVEAVHRASVNRFAWMWQAYPFAEGEVCCQKTTLSFVDSIWEIFGPLLAGVPSVILSQEDARDPRVLVRRLSSEGVSRIVLVPSLLSALLDSGIEIAKSLSKLKWWVSSGEALAIDLYRRFREAMPDAVLINLYGSSEVSADVTCWDSRGPEPLRSVPIGRPISNTRVYLLDDARQPVPIGVPGELYVGGDGLARGYRDRPDMTAERFVPDPFAPDPGARLFRTGDLARYLPDGNLEYLGRRDHQVKIRGQRIELGEIEAVIAGEAEVEGAAVVVRETPAGDSLLVAYVVIREGRTISPGQLRSRLERKLPAVMVPFSFRRLEAFPLTPSGKTDRQALPAFDGSRPEIDAEFVGPRTATEETLAGVWAELLDLDRVGVDDDFFALGGHSLLVIQLMSRLRDVLGVDLPVRAFFEAPTVAALSRRYDLARTAEESPRPPPLSPSSSTAPIPLSFAQQSLWVLDQVEPGSTAYLIRRAFRLFGPLDPATLRRAVDALVARHEILRTRFVASDGVAHQVVDAGGRADFREIDATAGSEGSPDADAAYWASQPEQPFDLTRGPMLRATLVRLAANDHLLLVTIHHIASDAWSIGILLREISVAYEALAAGRALSLPQLPIQYADFAVWQRNWLSGETLTSQLSYWREQLRGAPERIELATDRPRPPKRSGAGARRFLRLSADLSRDLENLGRGERATPYMTLLAGFALLLSRYTRQDDILIGSPIAGRNRDETEGLIGLFLNTLVLRARLSGDPSFTELIRRVRETVIHAFVHQDLPFEKLVDELRPARSLSHNPLFQVWFVLQNAPASPLEISGVEARPVSLPGGDARHDLQLTLWQTGEGLAGSIDYSTDLFDAATIDTMAERLEILLRLAADSPELPLSALGRALDQAEARRADANEKRIEETSRRSLKTAKRKGIRV